MVTEIETLANAYDRIKHIELTLAHNLPMRDVLSQIAALRALLRPFKKVVLYPHFNADYFLQH